MVDSYELLAFGPVPSRRLGQSLGINNTLPRYCSLSCVYCQLGRTRQMTVRRQPFYDPEALVRAVEARLQAVRTSGRSVDYLTFVADGEPTLDSDLGQEIALLKRLGVKLAVITNATLLWRGDVRDDLADADLVSLKVDVADDRAWRRVNRPHGSLTLAQVQQGMVAFAAGYKGQLITETMLVSGVNDSPDQMAAVGRFLAVLDPARAYLAVPVRPPAERRVQAPDQRVVERAYMILSASVANLDTLTVAESGEFGQSGDAVADLLSITAVHPMREQAVAELLAKTGADWSVVEKLIDEGRLARQAYDGTTFYLRRQAQACKS